MEPAACGDAMVDASEPNLCAAVQGLVALGIRSCQRQVVQRRNTTAVINALEQGTADATALERIMQLQYDTQDALEMAYDFLGCEIKKRKAKPLHGEHQMQPTLTGSLAGPAWVLPSYHQAPGVTLAPTSVTHTVELAATQMPNSAPAPMYAATVVQAPPQQVLYTQGHFVIP